MTSYRKQARLLGFAVAIISLQAMAQAWAQARVGPNAPPNTGRVVPHVTHPARFFGPDSVHLPTRPAPVTVLPMDGTEGMAMAGRTRRKHAGRPK
jgi:hypothetical protein